MVDTHAHIDPATSLSAGIEAALESSRQAGVTHMILMSPPRVAGAKSQVEADDLLDAAGRQRGTVFVAAGGGSLNGIIHATDAASVSERARASFRQQAHKLAELQVVAFGEIAARHLSLRNMGPQHAYEDASPDHPLMLELADVAAERGLPLDLHLDLAPADMSLPPRPLFNASTPAEQRENLAAFERLLAHNRKARIIWAHAGSDPLGTRVPELQRRLLRTHPNLYMSLRVPPQGNPAMDFMVTPAQMLKPVWRELIVEFPDRFVLGSDSFHAPSRARGPGKDTLSAMVSLLDQLPDQVAEMVAYRNAEKLFGLKLGPASGR